MFSAGRHISFFFLSLAFCLIAAGTCIISSQAKASVAYLPGYNELKISFNIDETTDYKIENKDDILRLSFNQPLAGQFAELQNRFPNIFTSSEIAEDGKSILLNLRQKIRIESSRNKDILTLDLALPEKKKTQQLNADELETARLKYIPHTGFSRFIIEFKQLPEYELRPAGEKTLLIFKKPFKLETNSLSGYKRRNEISFKSDENGNYVFTLPENLVQSFEQPNRIIVDTGSRLAHLPPEADFEMHPEDATSGRSQTIYRDSRLASRQAPVASPVQKIRSLSFSWNQPVNIAVFKRSRYLWIVFDHHQTLNIPEMSSDVSPLAKDLIQLPNPQATILRLTPEENTRVSIRKEGLLWVVDLYTGGKEPEIKEIPVFTQHDALNRSYLFLPAANAGNIISIFDPEIGDVMSIIPTSDTNLGMKNSYSYPDVDFHNSLNGLVIIFKADDIMINRGNTGVTLRRENKNLNISEDLNELKRQENLHRKNNEENGFFPPLPPEIFNTRFTSAVETLRQDVIKADDATLNRTRLQEAAYYLSKGLGTNALKILNTMEKENVPEAQTDIFHGMKGVAQFLNHRYTEALGEFSFGNLPSNEEAVFWRSLIAAAIEPRAEDNVLLMSYAYLFKNYPDEIRRRIALIGIEPALLVRDDISVQNYLDIIRESANDINRDAAVNYYNAKKLDLMGYPLNAIREYRNAAASDSQLFSALARRRIIDIQRKTRTIRPEKAIAEYEMLRYAWGERNFQISLLNDLANVYLEDKNYYKALDTLQKVSKLVENNEKPEITKKMITIFEDIYLRNQDDTLPALKSLALYQDYGWLAPLSPHYNEIVQKLADRLVAVDLLSRAYNLLQTQLENGNLTPLEKGTVATRMALINLFNNEPEKALNILDATENDQLPPTIIAHRRIIRAKALSAIGAADDALELLQEDYSKNGIMMKSEIYWNNGQWAEAADTIKYLIEKPQKGQPLNPEQMQLILDWATALKKAGRETVIVRLKNTFEPFFKATPFESAFNVLTDTLEENKIDLKNIDETINNISAFSNFAKIYSQTLQNSTLSETIQ